MLLSCRKENALDCFKSNGPDKTETRLPGDFKYVEVYDNMEVFIFQGTEYKVEVTAGENIIKNISTKIKDDTLRLDNNNKCNVVRGYKRKVKIKITMPYLEQVSNYGVGPITFDENIKQDKIFVKAENSGDTYINGTYDEIRTSSHGNGDMYFKGTTKNLQVYTSGTNYTRAEELSVTNYVFISSYSIGDAFLTVRDNVIIDYLISSDGNIYYKGNASINNLSTDQGNGRAIKQD